MAEQGAGDEMPVGEYQVMDAVDFLRDVLGIGASVPEQEHPAEASMDKQKAPARVENIWCGLCGTYVRDMDHHHIGGQSRGGVT